MVYQFKMSAAAIAGALTFAAAQLASSQAQTPASPQYVVTYGELAPDVQAQQSGSYLLAELTRLAKSSGAQYFSVNTEIDRPNFFTLVEIWQTAAEYSAFTSASNVQKTLQYLQPLLLAPLDERDGNLVTAAPAE